MRFRLLYIVLIPFLFSSCFLKKKSSYAQDDAYGELSDINAHQRPSTMAKEIAELSKKQKKAYLKHLKKTKKEMVKRNKKKLKNIVLKTKTKKTKRRKDTEQTIEIK